MKHPNMLTPSPTICIGDARHVGLQHICSKSCGYKDKNNYKCVVMSATDMPKVTVTRTKTNTSRNEMVNMKTRKKIVVIQNIAKGTTDPRVEFSLRK